MAAGFRARRFHADHARELANKAIREPDRAGAWSIRMEGYGGPALSRRQSWPCRRASPMRLRSGGTHTTAPVEIKRRAPTAARWPWPQKKRPRRAPKHNRGRCRFSRPKRRAEFLCLGLEIHIDIFADRAGGGIKVRSKNFDHRQCVVYSRSHVRGRPARFDQMTVNIAGADFALSRVDKHLSESLLF